MEQPPREPRYPQLATEINAMTAVDQEMREQNLADQDRWDVLIDKRNAERMKAIVSEIGWPTISKVGADASYNAWLLVQHADHDVAFQKQCLELMDTETEGEVNKRNVAYLEDRVRVNEGRPQIYGTQWHGEGDNYNPRPIEDSETVNDRRKQMGMETMEEYEITLREKYNLPPKK